MKNRKFFNLISILLLLICEFLHGSSSSLNPPECGRRINEIRGKRLNKIVGGNVANPGDWGWQTILKYTIPELNINEKFLCGGSLINTEWVITAAHCIILPDPPITVKPEQLKLIFGLHDRSKPEPYSTTRKVSEIIVHPDYKNLLNQKKGLQDDIALIKLAEPVNFTEHILPICLPESNSDFSNKEAWATGWGKTANEDSSIYLNELKVPILNDSICTAFYAAIKWSFNPLNSICTDNLQKQLTDPVSTVCNADSGGPLVVKVGEKWQLAGISSWVVTRDETCWVSAFAKTSVFMDWIRGSINPAAGGKENLSPNQITQMISICLSILFILNSVF